MLKFIAKKVTRRGSGSKKSEKGAEDAATAVTTLFEFSDANVSRFTDLLEVAVRSKISNKRGDPLRIIEDESTDRLVSDFINGSLSKSQLESYSPSSLWSAAVQVLKDSKPVFEEDKCNTLRSANYDDVSQLARSLPQHSQKLIGVLCASAEMLIRSEPAAAPMILNSLSNSIIWSLPLNSFVTTNALVNLIVDHRALFPACHTFARKISTSFLPITPEEWRVLAKTSASIYAHVDHSTDPDGGGMNDNDHAESDSDTDGQARKGPKYINNTDYNHKNSINNNSLSGPKPAGVGGDRLSLIAQGRGAGASNEGIASEGDMINNKSKPWRSAYTEELPFNDINASASIDVSARLGLKPSAEPAIHNNNNNSNTTTTTPTINPNNTNPSGGRLTLKDIQGVFSSSLVSAASLDFLRVNTIVTDDYADSKTLSSTVKWILQAQDLSDALANNKTQGANKGIISWTEFLLLADPYLRAPYRAYIRAHPTVKYNQVVDVQSEDSGSVTSGSSGAGSSYKQDSRTTYQTDAKETTRTSVSHSQQKEKYNRSKLRSRSGFKSSGNHSSSEGSDSESSDAKHSIQGGSKLGAKNTTTANKVNTAKSEAVSYLNTGRFYSDQNNDKHSSNTYTNNKSNSNTNTKGNTNTSGNNQHSSGDEAMADLDEVEEMELEEKPNTSYARNTSTHNTRTSSTTNNNNKNNNNNNIANYNSDNSATESDSEVHFSHKNTANDRVSHFEKNKSRQWEDPDTNDNISITSGTRSAPVRRVSGTVNTSFGTSALVRQTSQNNNKNSVFDLDLLDDSVASIPLMNDQSIIEEEKDSFHRPPRTARDTNQNTTKNTSTLYNNNSSVNKSSVVNKSVDRSLPIHNSFDDESTDEGTQPEELLHEEQDEAKRDRPLSSSFVSDSDEADSFKMPPRPNTSAHSTGINNTTTFTSNNTNTGYSAYSKLPLQSADQSLMANSFDEEDPHEELEGMEEGKEDRELTYRTIALSSNTSTSGRVANPSQPPLVGRSSQHIQQLPLEDNIEDEPIEGGLDGAPPVKKKHGVKKFMKMFSLTSTSVSSKSSVNNSLTSSVHGSPLRTRGASIDSDHTANSANSMNISTLDNTALNAAAPKSKSMFGRMKSSVSKPFKSVNTNANTSGASGSGRSDIGSETGSQISVTDQMAIHNESQDRGRAGSFDSTNSAHINANSPLDDLPAAKVKKNMLGRITSKISKPFKSTNSSNRSDAGSDVGSQISGVSGTEHIAEQYRDQQKVTAEHKKLAKDNASATTATAGAVDVAPTGPKRADSFDSTDSPNINDESHFDDAPSAKVMKNMLGRITSKISKPFKSTSNSSNRSDAGSDAGSQVSAMDQAAVEIERRSYTSATERGRVDSFDSTDSAHIKNEPHLDDVPSAKVKKNMLGRITSKISKPFKSTTGSSNRSDAGSDVGSQISAVDQAALTADLTATAPAKALTSASLPINTTNTTASTAATTVNVTAPAKSPKPTIVSKDSSVPTPAAPKYASYASALAHVPENKHNSDRARASSFESTDSANLSHIEGLPSADDAKNTTSAIEKPKKSVLGRVASKMSKPFKPSNKSESGKSDRDSEVDSQISAQDHIDSVEKVTSGGTGVTLDSAPLTAAALRQYATTDPVTTTINANTTTGTYSSNTTGNTATALGLSTQRIPLERVSSLDSTSTHDHIGQPKLKKGVFGRITSKLSKPFKSGKSGTSSTGSIVGEDDMSENASQTSHEEQVDSIPNTASVPSHTHVAGLQKPVAVMESVDLDSPLSGKTGSSGKYSIGIADAGRVSLDTDEVPNINSTTATTAAAATATPTTTNSIPQRTLSNRLPPTPRTVARDRAASDAVSEEGSVNSAHTHETASSTGSKKGKPTLKGMMHKSYKVVFQGNQKNQKGVNEYTDEGAVTTANTNQQATETSTLSPPEKPAKVPFRFKKAGERQAAEEINPSGQPVHTEAPSSGTNSEAKKSSSPPKPVKPASLSTAQPLQTMSHPVPHVSHVNPVPQPSSPTIYSAEDVIAGMHANTSTTAGTHSSTHGANTTTAAGISNRPLPTLPTTTANQTATTNTNNTTTTNNTTNEVITADRRLSNPALKKRSSFSLSGLFGFGNGGSKNNSKNNSRDSSRAPSRSNSFNGETDITSPGGNSNSVSVNASGTSLSVSGMNMSNRESTSHRPHSTRDASPQRAIKDGTGLAALLRGQVPSHSPTSTTLNGARNSRFTARNDAYMASNAHSAPMSPLTPSTPYPTHSYETHYDSVPSPYNQEDQAEREMTNIIMESSRLASQSILDRVHLQQNKYTETHSAPHKVNVLQDLQRIKQKRTQEHHRLSSHHHRHLDPHLNPHSAIGSDVENSDEDGITSVSSPAQRKLLLNWQNIVSRRAPQSVFLTTNSLLEMRQLVHKSRGDDIKDDLIALDDADEEAMHRQKRRQMSTVPDPLFGLSLHDKAALSHLRLSKALHHANHSTTHSANHSLAASLSLKPINAADLSSAQLNKLVQENAFYSELDLALGVKFSGHLSRVVSRFWRQRYFVLMVEPTINPNLFPQDGSKEGTLPSSTPSMQDSPATHHNDPSTVPSSSHHTNHTDQPHTSSHPTYNSSTTSPNPINNASAIPNPSPVPLLVAPTDPTATASGPVPGKYQYYLLEYEHSVSSLWGEVPVKLLRRYPAGDILSLRTDTRAHKKGLEFTVILRRNSGTNPITGITGTTGESTKSTKESTVGGTRSVSMKDFVSPSSEPHSASSTKGQSTKNQTELTVTEEPSAKGLKSLVKKSQPGGRLAAVVKAEQKKAQLEATLTAVDPSNTPTVAPVPTPAPPTDTSLSTPSLAPTPAAAPAVAPALSVTEEEAPIIETRWNRLLRRNSNKEQDNKPEPSTTAPDVAPPTTTISTIGPSNAAAATAGTSEEKETEEEVESSEDEKEADSDPELDFTGENEDDNDSHAEGDIDDIDDVDDDVDGDAATSIGGDSQFGDFYYRDGTLPPGINEADLRNGKRINKKDFIKLKLKAPTPDERLQWVQIIHSVAAPTMYINTTSY